VHRVSKTKDEEERGYRGEKRRKYDLKEKERGRDLNDQRLAKIKIY
jgi:hypothetical protein